MPGLFSNAARSAYGAALGLAHRSVGYGIGGMAGRSLLSRGGAYGMQGLGNYMTALGAKSPTAWGATLGAGYGLLSDDTSVLGGALTGGFAGRYGSAGFMAGRGALRSKLGGPGGWGRAWATTKMAGRGMWGRGRGDWNTVKNRARQTKKFIGSTASRAWNPISSTLFG